LQLQAPTYYNAVSLLEEIPTTGNSPIRVIGPNFKAYVAKNSKSKFPATDIINELIAHYLLQCWQIHTPPIALINIDGAMLKPEYSSNHKPSYYKIPVFGSQWIDNAIELSALNSIQGNKDFNRFANPSQLLSIALFDIWVVNDDRKPTNTNILLTNQRDDIHIVPIDHSFIFASMNYQNLKPTDDYCTFNDHILETTLAKQLVKKLIKNQNWLQNQAQNYYICINECKNNFQ
jgi:hypothetical protein